MALAITGTPDIAGNAGATKTITYTYAANTLIVIVLNTYCISSGFATVTSVTDTNGLTWHRRRQTQYTSKYGISSVVNINQEIWWAYATAAQSGQTASLHVTGSANEGISPDITIFGVSGVTNTTAPWDTGTFGQTIYSDASVLGPSTPSASYTTNQANSMVLGFLTEYTSSGSTSPQTVGSGYTLIYSDVRGSSPNQIVAITERKAQASAGAGTVTYAGTGKLMSILTTDALSGTSTGSSTDLTVTGPTGTISTTLTKAALSVAAKEIFTGTILTALTKVSISAAGWAPVSGTATTDLTKVSQALSGIASAEAGNIVTRLTGISQTVSATEKFIADITTQLSAPSQEAAGWTTVSGTLVTALQGISQISSDLEIFTGTITTDLGAGTGFVTGIVGLEIFTGTITTDLSPANIAAAAEEWFIGDVVTRLGGETGRMVASVALALEIIQGPIETALPPFRPLILGAELGTPGGGKWFSWRYTDA
jgi:hypothetical protein